MAKDTEVAEWYSGVRRSARGATLFGLAIIAATLFGFGYWGTTAPIAGAIISAGSFVATGENKIIQHFDGGVIEKILVSEGDVVAEGQTLIRLDETEPKAEVERLKVREVTLTAMEARLKTELAEKNTIAFPEELLALEETDPNIAEVLDTQRQVLKARRNSVKQEIETLRQGMDALRQRIKGGKLQLESVRERSSIFEEELQAKNQLLSRGLIRKPEILSLQRSKVNLEGEIGRLNGEIGDARERIARTREQIAGVRNDMLKTAIEKLHETSSELKEVRERIRSARAVLNRIEITAPVQGVVVSLRYHTSGGVIEPGKKVMEILPLREELILEARVRPRDIDSVKKGQDATVRLAALNRRITPTVDGEVVYVSADAIGGDEEDDSQTTRQRSGQSDAYVARIRLDSEEASKVPGFSPTPGMPAEVYIKTADRTFLEYLTKPIIDSMARAFREL